MKLQRPSGPAAPVESSQDLRKKLSKIQNEAKIICSCVQGQPHRSKNIIRKTESKDDVTPIQNPSTGCIFLQDCDVKTRQTNTPGLRHNSAPALNQGGPTAVPASGSHQKVGRGPSHGSYVRQRSSPDDFHLCHLKQVKYGGGW